MQNFFKIISGFLLFLILTTTANTKPIPPGSGEGDVPANILFLLDSSISMRHDIVGGVGVQGGVDWAVELDDGNIIAAENGKGIFKFLIADGKRDSTFAGDMRFSDEENCLGKETKVNKSFAGDISSNDVIWFTSTQNSGQVIAIDSNGTCLGVINKNSGGRTTIGEIGTTTLVRFIRFIKTLRKDRNSKDRGYNDKYLRESVVVSVFTRNIGESYE
mgnify:CR=1 FL=1